METFNDDDQAQQLKDWWKQNWQPVLLGLGLSIGGVLGWNAWQSHQQTQAEQASGHFERLRLGLQAGSLEAANKAQQSLIDGYSSTAYAVQGALLLAQYFVQIDDLPAAEAHLQWAASHAKDDKLAHIATLRLARLQWAQGEDEQALALLKGSKQGAFAGLYAELRGDIYLAQGNIESARAAYEEALKYSSSDPLGRRPNAGMTASGGLLQKLDDLAPAPAAAPPEDS